MLRFGLPEAASDPLRVLALGCHADDIELGCAGTLLQLKHRAPSLEVRWVVFSASGDREREARASAEDLLEGVARAEVVLHEFRDGYLPYLGPPVKDSVEAMKDFAPDVVFTHQRADLHQDHRLISELTWNAFRDHLILEDEVPKYAGDHRSPDVVVPLDDAHRVRPVRRSHLPPQGRGPHAALRQPAEQALVHRGPLPRADAAAGVGER